MYFAGMLGWHIADAVYNQRINNFDVIEYCCSGVGLGAMAGLAHKNSKNKKTEINDGKR